MLNTLRNNFAIIIIGYIGIMFVLAPYILYNDLQFIFAEGKELGYLLLATAIIWAINKYYYQQSGLLDQSLHKLDKQGIEDINVLSHLNISDLVHNAFNSSTIRLQVNYHEVNKNVLHIIDVLESHQSKKEIIVLIAGVECDLIKEIIGGRSGTFEQKYLFDLLRKLVEENSSLSVRVSPTNVSHTVIFADKILSLLVPYDPKSGGLLHLRISAYSEVGTQYRQQFDQIWENSEELPNLSK